MATALSGKSEARGEKVWMATIDVYDCRPRKPSVCHRNSTMECFKVSLLLLLVSIGLVVRGDQTAPIVPAKSFKLTLQPVYSNEFIQMFVPYVEVGQVVFELTQTLFKEASLKYKFYLNFLPMLRINQTISNVRDGLAVARKQVDYQQRGNADAYIFLSADTDEEAAGYIPNLAVTEGHVCQKGSRPFSIVMWKSSDSFTARVLARQIGTLLKMKDDYLLDVTDRESGDDARRNCVTGATYKTVMGWDSSADNSWSKCSNDDFADYHKSVVAEDGYFCLEAGWCKHVEL